MLTNNNANLIQILNSILYLKMCIFKGYFIFETLLFLFSVLLWDFVSLTAG